MAKTIERTTENLALVALLVALCSLGAIMVYSSTYAFAVSRDLDAEFFLKRHLTAIAIGLCAFAVIQVPRYSLIKRAVPSVAFLGALSLFLVLLQNPGMGHGGSQRWLQLGPFSVQPTEFCRFVFLAFFAYLLERRGGIEKPVARNYLLPILFWLVACLLILLEPHYSLFVELGILLFILLYATGFPRLPLACVLVANLCVAVVFMFTSDYRLARFVAFIAPHDYYQTSGYQVVHALVSFSSAGFTGAGIGAGTQKLFYLPEQYNDYIFAVIGEELGFAGVSLCATAYLVLFLLCLRMAQRAPDIFGALFTFGTGALLTLSAFLNMSVCLKLLPPTGMVLPLVSYGGSSMVASIAALGLVYRIGREWKQL